MSNNINFIALEICSSSFLYPGFMHLWGLFIMLTQNIFIWAIITVKFKIKPLWFTVGMIIIMWSRAVIKSWGLGIFPGFYEHGPRLLSLENRRKIEPKEISSCFFYSPPTCCICPATWNLSDSPGEVTVGFQNSDRSPFRP